MPSHFRQLMLIAHIVACVGWLGAVLPYLLLAIGGLVSRDLGWQRTVYGLLPLLGARVLIPLSFAALLTGLVLSLGTRWGLFRYWWIVTKFTLTLAAVGILLQHMRLVERAARLAQTVATALDPQRFRIPLVIHPAGGLLVLFLITAISVVKPWGMTSWGRRRLSERPSASARPAHLVSLRAVAANRPAVFWVGAVGAHVAGIAAVLFAIVRIASYRLGGQ